MQIRYKLDMDDLAKFAQYHYRKTPAARKIFITQLIVWPLFVFGIAYLFNSNPDPIKRLVPGLAGAAVTAALVPWLYSYSIGRSLRKIYSEGPTLGLFGEHTLSIEPDGLRESSEAGEQFAKWSGIYRVVEIESHGFIYLGPILVHVIPKAQLADGVLEQFFSEVKRHVPPPNA